MKKDLQHSLECLKQMLTFEIHACVIEKHKDYYRAELKRVDHLLEHLPNITIEPDPGEIPEAKIVEMVVVNGINNQI